MKIAQSDFPSKPWDGLCYQYRDTSQDKNPDFFWADKVTAEIISVENWLYRNIVQIFFQESVFKGDVVTNTGYLANNSLNDKHAVLGLASEDVPAGTLGEIQCYGIMTLDNWFNIAGTLHLEPGKNYFLDSISGNLTTLIPEQGWFVRIGLSTHNNKLLINPQPGIKL